MKKDSKTDCMNNNTGSLTITNITPEHYGHYKLQIIIERRKISETFNFLLLLSLTDILLVMARRSDMVTLYNKVSLCITNMMNYTFITVFIHLC